MRNRENDLPTGKPTHRRQPFDSPNASESRQAPGSTSTPGTERAEWARSGLPPDNRYRHPAQHRNTFTGTAPVPSASQAQPPPPVSQAHPAPPVKEIPPAPPARQEQPAPSASHVQSAPPEGQAQPVSPAGTAQPVPRTSHARSRQPMVPPQSMPTAGLSRAPRIPDPASVSPAPPALRRRAEPTAIHGFPAAHRAQGSDSPADEAGSRPLDSAAADDVAGRGVRPVPGWPVTGRPGPATDEAGPGGMVIPGRDQH